MYVCIYKHICLYAYLFIYNKIVTPWGDLLDIPLQPSAQSHYPLTTTVSRQLPLCLSSKCTVLGWQLWKKAHFKLTFLHNPLSNENLASFQGRLSHIICPQTLWEQLRKTLSGMCLMSLELFMNISYDGFLSGDTAVFCAVARYECLFSSSGKQLWLF